MSEKSVARHVQAEIELDPAYERASYLTCLQFVRKHGPLLRESLRGQEGFQDKYRAALVVKAKEFFRCVRVNP